MFKYVVKGYGYDGAGESEEWVEYDGTNRVKALKGYKRALDWAGSASIDVTVLGREWQKLDREKKEWEAEREHQMELEADYWASRPELTRPVKESWIANQIDEDLPF
jgi:hypothetical protein